MSHLEKLLNIRNSSSRELFHCFQLPKRINTLLLFLETAIIAANKSKAVRWFLITTSTIGLISAEKPLKFSVSQSDYIPTFKDVLLTHFLS